ncbi:MAG TPA: hypothetical protein VK730_05230 [Solirubrobacteraceae bacterium]|jgi:hypothetical protein|nr:hypothetical protein [Solirubrobacteraceae bacterium]
MPNIHRPISQRIQTFTPILLACAATVFGALAPATASASHSQTMYFEAPRDLVEVTPAARTKAFAQLQALGVKALRVELDWANVAPGAHSTKKPTFEATNPASYNWSAYDALLIEAARLKWQVLLTVTSPVPEWATASQKDKSGVTRPNDADFKEFMTAVGRHYAGFVSLYAIWNEPNHPAFLQPQFNSKGMPESPRIYRGLFQAGYEGLQASGIAKPKVLMGETAPVGYDTVSRSEIRREGAKALLHDVAPLAFLRETLCLNSKYQKASTCEMLPAYGYAHHAYTTGAGPFYKPAGADNVMIGVLSRLSSALAKAERAHAIPAHIPIYLTEFGIQSYPNRELGVSLPQQAEYDAIAEKIAWENPRVAAFSQYLLRDDPLGGKAGSSVHGGYVGFQTGLETVSGARKPLYFGFPVPLVVSRHGHGFSLWGLVRPTSGPTTLKVLVQPKGSKSYRTLESVHTNSLGYWSLNSSVQGSRWRVSWRSPAGVAYNGPPMSAY